MGPAGVAGAEPGLIAHTAAGPLLRIGYGAGELAHAGGASVPQAILTGGGSFASAALLLLALWYFATGHKQ